MKNFALIGAAGYIAPRHMKAIKDVGGNLVVAVDPHDSVGILDQHFPDCSFFTEFERFDRHCEKLRREGRGVDYVSICSPNYLHDAHCRFALRIGADPICEKPLVLRERNLDALEILEEETGHNVWSILQLRYHPKVQEVKDKLVSMGSAPHSVQVRYISPRGRWYGYSWKGDVEKSGGIATNIGAHLFDLLAFFFGKHSEVSVLREEKHTSAGVIRFADARADWYLSTEGKATIRSFEIDGEEIELTRYFNDLHTAVYRAILAGRGNGIASVRESIRICEEIRR